MGFINQHFYRGAPILVRKTCGFCNTGGKSKGSETTGTPIEGVHFFFSLMKTRYHLCKPMGWKHVWNMKSATSVVSNRHFNGDLGLERKMLSFGICSYSVGHEAPFPSICLLVYGWSDCVCMYIYMVLFIYIYTDVCLSEYSVCKCIDNAERYLYMW